MRSHEAFRSRSATSSRALAPSSRRVGLTESRLFHSSEVAQIGPRRLPAEPIAGCGRSDFGRADLVTRTFKFLNSQTCHLSLDRSHILEACKGIQRLSTTSTVYSRVSSRPSTSTSSHAEMCDNWGYSKLGAFIKLQAIGEMRHAEILIERILFLEGVPGMGELSPLNVGQNVHEQLGNDVQLEYEAVRILNVAIKDAVAAGDNASRELFETILKDEESTSTGSSPASDD